MGNAHDENGHNRLSANEGITTGARTLLELLHILWVHFIPVTVPF